MNNDKKNHTIPNGLTEFNAIGLDTEFFGIGNMYLIELNPEKYYGIPRFAYAMCTDIFPTTQNVDDITHMAASFCIQSYDKGVDEISVYINDIENGDVKFWQRSTIDDAKIEGKRITHARSV